MSRNHPHWLKLLPWILVCLLAAAATVALQAPSDVAGSKGAEPASASDQEPTAHSPGHGPHEVDLTHTNHLASETSPYLLLHQHNPVDWYPWGPEALAKARTENKPIFLSVGYSTCYWCHVMERQSFSDPEIAKLLNQWFVNIKVDREERPDLDEIYMTATQIMTRRGGWPNSVFLTPELEPFFAGTYFPPDDILDASGQVARRGFRSLLHGLHDAWENQHDAVRQQAAQLREHMQRVIEDRRAPTAELPGPSAATACLAGLEKRFDSEWGGFGSSPKFPSPSNLFLLLHFAPESERAKEMLGTTLDRMARGGVYDQVGGGFHRYSTDRKWLVPHFEKMLYDNGSLLEVYGRWFGSTGDPQAERILRQTAEFLTRELTSPEGALWSAIDAETDAREGAFYIWTRAELDAELGEQAAFLAPIFGFADEPFFRDPHGDPADAPTYVLHLPTTLAEQASRLDLSAAELAGRIEPLSQRLLTKRDQRKRPLTDDKILTDWNGLAIAGLATAGQALDDDGMLEQARRAARFVLQNMRPQNQPLQHSWRGGNARIDAYLVDYAYFVHGLLALHAATGEALWLTAAIELTEEQLQRLWDNQQGGFFVAAEDPDLLFRSKDIGDSARPSPNGMSVLNLLQLAERTQQPRWRQLAEASLKSAGAALKESPQSATTMSLAAAIASGESLANAQAVAKPESPSQLDTVAQKAVSVRATVQGSKLQVDLEIEAPWHVNANPASDEYLIPTQIAGAGLGDATYPAGHPFEAEFSDQTIQVYQGTVRISAEIADPDSFGDLSLTYQLCDEQRCLPPVTKSVNISP